MKLATVFLLLTVCSFYHCHDWTENNQKELEDKLVGKKFFPVYLAQVISDLPYADYLKNVMLIILRDPKVQNLMKDDLKERNKPSSVTKIMAAMLESTRKRLSQLKKEECISLRNKKIKALHEFRTNYSRKDSIEYIKPATYFSFNESNCSEAFKSIDLMMLMYSVLQELYLRGRLAELESYFPPEPVHNHH